MKDIKDRFPVYSKLLKLYPGVYRKHYEEEMLITTADMLENVSSSKGKIIVWSGILFDLSLNIAKQNLQYAGGIMHSTMPNYIKRNSLISGILLVPFATALVANMIDIAVHNRSLSNTGLWQRQEILWWVVILPALAFIITAASYIYFVFKCTNKNKKWLSRALDIIHSWPVLIVGIMAFGILFMVEFHDSTQCIVKSPIHAITNVSQTLHCVENNRTIIPREDY